MPDGSGSFETRGGRDPATLAAVYRAHAGYVWRVLRHCGVPDPDLDDAVQETFLVVFRRLPELERASLRTWIYAVAVRVASTRRRSQRREASRREHAGRGVHGIGAVDPEAELSKAEAADLVDRLLEELDTPKRTVFVLAELEGVKVPEISRILGVNPRTVHSRLRLARESFGSALRRMQAHEQGNRRIARMRPRPLLEQAANDRPPAARRKAVMAAIAARIEQGATPVLPGWEALSLGSGWAGAWGLPAAVIAAVGVLTAVTLAAPASSGRTTNEPAGVSESNANEPRTPHVGGPSSPNGPQTPYEWGPSSTNGSRTPYEWVPSTANGSRTPPEWGPSTTPNGSSPPSEGLPSVPNGPRTPYARVPSTAGGSQDPNARVPSTADGSQDSSVGPTPSADAPAAGSTSASALAAETLLLEQARRALRRGDHDAALAALDAHASEHPQGLLLDEARSTRLRALCAAGRSTEATALADQWSATEAGSRWHDVVASTCW